MLTIKELEKFFAGKKIFITGHTGFKGSWLTFILNMVGAEVTGFSLPPSTAVNHFDLLKLDTKIKHFVGDVRDGELLAKILQECQPEIVFHLAAQSLVRPSYDDPVSTFSTNIMGSVNLLEAVRQCRSVRSLIYVTSDKCYENVEWVWGYRENDQLGGNDPYSSSKAAAELIFASYTRSFFEQRNDFGAASVRAGNVIGGGDWATDRIIPDCIRAIQANQPIFLRNPNSTRPWQHVLEPLAGYLLLSARLYDNPKFWKGAWNFGPSTQEVRTVKNIADLIIGHIGTGSVDMNQSEIGHHEAQLLQLNCDKAHQLLGWYPRWHVEKTIESTALWYKSIMAGDDAETVSRLQIEEFFSEL